MLVITASGNWARETVPANCPAGSVPSKLLALLAKIEQGTGVNGWSGFNVVNVLTPLLATPICNQLVWPVNAPAPKSISTVNKPLVTFTELLVTGPAAAMALALVLLNSVNCKL